jgi:pilus assembly protein CpaB
MASNALSTAGRKSSRRSLMVAVVFGVLSAVLVLSYLKSARGGGENKGLVTVPVVFALRDIPERTQIKEGMLEVRQIPADAAHVLAIQEKNRAVGQITRVPIAAGEQVLSNKIADQVRDVGFSASVPEGRRAVAVAVDEVVASGGHIAPGDFVDVIAVFEVYAGDPKTTGQSGPRDFFGKDQGDKPKVFSSVTILQNIQVLAVAQKADATLPTGGDKKSGGLTGGSSRDEAKSVTLAVTPEQAERIFLAEEIGKLRLALRPFGDQEQRNIPAVYNNLTDLVGN